MRLNQPSLTAQRTAVARAAHQMLDQPRIFEDPIAAKIIGGELAARIASAPEDFQSVYAVRLRAYLVARSRYAEDTLAEAVQRGVRQYVILGAGLDTFAYRNPYPAELLRVFEVDHPSTQAWKRERLAAEGIPLPDGLSFVAIDFETQALAERLSEAGLEAGRPAVFVWLGVSMYLAAETVLGTLQSIVQFSAPGSEIVFDYALDPSLLAPEVLHGYQARAARVAAAGEPWKSTFEPERFAAELRGMGYDVIEDLGPEEINRRYFLDLADGLRAGSRAHVMRVRVEEEQQHG